MLGSLTADPDSRETNKNLQSCAGQRADDPTQDSDTLFLVISRLSRVVPHLSDTLVCLISSGRNDQFTIIIRKSAVVVFSFN